MMTDDRFAEIQRLWEAWESKGRERRRKNPNADFHVLDNPNGERHNAAEEMGITEADLHEFLDQDARQSLAKKGIRVPEFPDAAPALHGPDREAKL